MITAGQLGYGDRRGRGDHVLEMGAIPLLSLPSRAPDFAATSDPFWDGWGAVSCHRGPLHPSILLQCSILDVIKMARITSCLPGLSRF